MARAIRPRKMDFPFDAGIAKHWLGGSLLGSHLANGLNLLFPFGERYFIRSVKYYLDRISDDPELEARVRGFFGQEGFHAREHERFFEIMEGQGFEIRKFLEQYERIGSKLLEPMTPPKLRLSITVALEHFTAMFAERALSRTILDDIHPVMQALLRWHASEEIEHKSVAFDVLMRVDPSYALRISGLVIATISLLAFWFVATRMLIEQDDERTTRRLLAELKDAFETGELGRGAMARAFLVYLKPGFHPSQIANDRLAEEYLASIGRSAA